MSAVFLSPHSPCPLPSRERMNTTGLTHFSKVTCFSTLVLIFMGGLVKSHEAGLSVPDWPTTYGENLFLFHPSQWVGGIFYEHTHRLVASFVGFLTLVLSLGLFFKESRKWVRVLGYTALGTVILQGFLGGITVKFYLPVLISSAHAVLAQTFFLITILIAYVLSNEWQERIREKTLIETNFWKLSAILLGIIFMQLVLGALMRHTESGLAILDFPLVAGKWIPIFNDTLLQKINAARFQADLEPVNLAQVSIHFAHRVGALLVTITALCLSFQVFRNSNLPFRVKYSVGILMIVLLVQISLGVMTVLTQKSPLLTSFHVVAGAVTLGISALILLRTYPFKF